MARLSLVHREVLALRELEGESYQSIAAIARCPVGTVMSRLHHARQRLAETLAPQGAAQLRQAA
jgi:RNA polymerase sigma-70 factor (ECF subfamily)